MRYLLFILFVSFCTSCDAQKEISQPVNETIQIGGSSNEPETIANWNFSIKPTSTGDTYKVIARLSLAKDWHIFDFEPGGDGFLIAPDITFESKEVEIIGKKAIGTLVQAELAGMDQKVRFYENEVSFEVLIRSKSKEIKGSFYYQLCDHEKCLAPTEEPFALTTK